MRLSKNTSYIFFSNFFKWLLFKLTALLGPGVTIATTGNILQAGFQYGANSLIEKETGKNTFEHFQDAFDNQDENQKVSRKIYKPCRKKIRTY